MSRGRRLTVLVTGASRGLGLAIGRTLIASGRYRVLLTAREASLPRFAEAGIFESESIKLRALDVTSEVDRLRVVEEAASEWGGVDVLVNNAGVSYRAVVEHITDADRIAQFEVNYNGPMELTRLVLAGMRERRFGRIINISSVGGMMAMPTMSVYSASKFALEGASEALFYEVRPWNIAVTLVQPGFINSDGFEQVRYTDQSQASQGIERSPYHAHYHYMSGFIGRMMRHSPATPESVARHVLRVIEQRRPPLRAPATFDASLFALVRRLLPRALYHSLLYWMLPGIKSWGPRLECREPRRLSAPHLSPREAMPSSQRGLR